VKIKREKLKKIMREIALCLPGTNLYKKNQIFRGF